jgi:vitamin B12 transporter
VFTSATVNSVNEAEGCFDANFNPFNCNTTYHGSRFGAEYQGELALNRLGSLIFGARTMVEYASTAQSPNPNDGSFTPINAEQTTNSLYAEYRLPLFSRIDFTLGGRVDSILEGQTFVTGRTTVAYHIDETGTKLRAAFGNAAKAPTLYQRYSLYGNPNLLPEKNVGGEVGVDQSLFGGMATLSATVFDAYYQDLINFADVPSCTPAALASAGGCYYNVGSARTKGVEFSGEATLIPGVLRVKGSYTYLDARNLQTNTQLLRVPENAGSISAVWSPTANIEIEPRLILVGPTPDFVTNGSVTLPGYARIDVIGSYKFNDNVTAYVRLVNLTNANYEEVYNFGQPGRSAYVGLTARF